MSKRVIFGAIMFALVFVPFFNNPRVTQAEMSIDSPTYTEDDFLRASPVGTASVKTEIETYVVEEGDSIGSVAAKFDLSPYTISVTNGLAWNSKLKVGQELKILPVSGLLHEVEKGDTLSGIAKKYSVTQDVIIYQNKIEEGATLTVGEELIVPNGVKPVERSNPSTNTGRSSSSGSGWQPSASQLPSINSAGSLVKPSNSCRYTQYYKYGHYAIDCAAAVGTPLYAAEGGTVTKVSVGTWGGGYGSYVVIDHGGGLQTLYAHMNTVYVSKGQWVNRGENIGTMGNTGRSTGPHVHFEVIEKGVKKNPLSYF